MFCQWGGEEKFHGGGLFGRGEGLLAGELFGHFLCFVLEPVDDLLAFGLGEGGLIFFGLEVFGYRRMRVASEFFKGAILIGYTLVQYNNMVFGF